MRAYVQSHQIHSELIDDRQTRFETCAEIWFDSVEDAMTVRSQPVYEAHIGPDEPVFADMANLRFLLAKEEVLKSGPDHRKPLSAAETAADAFAAGVRELWWGGELDLEEKAGRDRSAWEELVLRPRRWSGYIARAERFL